MKQESLDTLHNSLNSLLGYVQRRLTQKLSDMHVVDLVGRLSLPTLSQFPDGPEDFVKAALAAFHPRSRETLIGNVTEEFLLEVARQFHPDGTVRSTKECRGVYRDIEIDRDGETFLIEIKSKYNTLNNDTKTGLLKKMGIRRDSLLGQNPSTPVKLVLLVANELVHGAEKSGFDYIYYTDSLWPFLSNGSLDAKEFGDLWVEWLLEGRMGNIGTPDQSRVDRLVKLLPPSWLEEDGTVDLRFVLNSFRAGLPTIDNEPGVLELFND